MTLSRLYCLERPTGIAKPSFSLHFSLDLCCVLEKSCEGRSEEGEREAGREPGRLLLPYRREAHLPLLPAVPRLLRHPVDTVLCMLVLYSMR